ncbi:MAG: MMPL family transporter [Bacteroidia bacterium]|nr:MMPL family transporter [Bacteroidia bacterium]
MKWIINYKRQLLVITILVTLFLGYGMRNLVIDFNFESFYPKGLPEAVFYKKFQETFTEDQNYMISLALKSPEKDVFDVNFLKKADSLFTIISQYDHVDSFIIGTQFGYPKRSGMGSVKQVPYFNLDSQEEVDAAREKIEKDTAITGTIITKDQKYICSHYLVEPEFYDSKAKDTLVAKMDAILESNNIEYIATGVPYIRSEYSRKLRFEAFLFPMLCSVMIAIFLIITFRNFYLVVIPLVTVLLGGVWTYGLMATIGQPINLLTNLIIPVILVVGISDIVHITTKYLHELKAGLLPDKAMRVTLEEIGFATFLTCITTATGFASLSLSDPEFMKPLIQSLGIKYIFGEDIPPIRNFGIYGCFGVVSTYFISITLIPNILTLIPKEKLMSARSFEGSKKWDSVLLWILKTSTGNKGKVIAVFLAIILFCVYWTFQIPTNMHMLEELTHKDPVRKSLTFFEKNLFGVRPFEMEVRAKGGKTLMDREVLLEVEKIQRYLQKDTTFNLFISPVTFIKSANYVYHFNRPKYFAIPDSQETIDEIYAFAEASGDNTDFLRHILTEDNKKGRISARTADEGSDTHREKEEKLKEFIRQNCNLNLFEYQITGHGHLTENSLNYLRDNLMNGLIIDFIVIGLVMGLVFRSFRMVILGLLPNMIPLLATSAVMGMAGITLTASTSIIFVVIFGIAVDDTLHFMAHYKLEIDKGVPKKDAIRITMLETGKAMILTSVILLSGYSILLTSTFGSTVWIGLFSLMTIVFAILTDLFLSPLLIYYFGPEEKIQKPEMEKSHTEV